MFFIIKENSKTYENSKNYLEFQFTDTAVRILSTTSKNSVYYKSRVHQVRIQIPFRTRVPQVELNTIPN